MSSRQEQYFEPPRIAQRETSPQKEIPIPLIRLILDIDDTLFATQEKWLEILNHEFKTNLTMDDFCRYGHTDFVSEWLVHGERYRDFLEKNRESDEFNGSLTLLEGALTGVNRLLQNGSTLHCYLTTRPEKVKKGTLDSITQAGLPQAPVIFRPGDISYSDSNRWKAKKILHMASEDNNMWVTIDDSPRLAEELNSVDNRIAVIVLKKKQNDGKVPFGPNIFTLPWSEIHSQVYQWRENLKTGKRIF